MIKLMMKILSMNGRADLILTIVIITVTIFTTEIEVTVEIVLILIETVIIMTIGQMVETIVTIMEMKEVKAEKGKDILTIIIIKLTIKIKMTIIDFKIEMFMIINTAAETVNEILILILIGIKVIQVKEVIDNF